MLVVFCFDASSENLAMTLYYLSGCCIIAFVSKPYEKGELFSSNRVSLKIILTAGEGPILQKHNLKSRYTVLGHFTLIKIIEYGLKMLHMPRSEFILR